MKKRTFLFLITLTLFLFSCKDNEKTELNPQWNYKYIKGFGKYKDSSYIFCSIIPKEIDYDYKVGTWAFYSPQKVKIAEGVFDRELIVISDHGGCKFSYYVNIATPENWKFWDSHGNPKPTNKRDLDFIMSYPSDFEITQ